MEKVNTEDTCFICRDPAQSDEHVIPRWLQKRFNLWNQTLTLPNGTSIPYRQLTIRACKTCNSEVYGALERRIKNGTASQTDIWRWANKIHYGLGHKDKFLEWDRKNPGNKIADITKSSDPLSIERRMLLSASGKFKTDPEPYGSIFTFDFKSPQRFFFCHFFLSSSICINIGQTGYVIFVNDGQTTQKSSQLHYEEARSNGRIEDMLFFYANCVEN